MSRDRLRALERAVVLFLAARLDQWGGPETYPHMAAGWAVALLGFVLTAGRTQGRLLVGGAGGIARNQLLHLEGQ